MSRAAKAYVAAFVAFLGPVFAYLALTGAWDWRAFAASVVAGLIAGGGTYATPNAPAVTVGRHEAGHPVDGEV